MSNTALPQNLSTISKQVPSTNEPLVNAFMKFALDPESWNHLIKELESPTESFDKLDHTDLLDTISKIEALSWHIQQTTTTAYQGPYILIGDADRVLGSRDTSALVDYLEIKKDLTLHFKNKQTNQDWEQAKSKISHDPNALLVPIQNINGERKKFLYLVKPQNSSSHATHPHTKFILMFANAAISEQLTNNLSSNFHLTNAELRLATKIAEGMSLKECANEDSISVNTARNQLQSVFQKLGVSRQSDLVLVLNQLSFMLNTGQGSESDVEKFPSDSDYPPYQFVILPDGRRLSYRVYGKSDEDPLLYFHETYGSSRLPPNTSRLAEQFNLKIIAVERPGTGLSTPNSNLTFQNFAEDIKQFLDILSISRVRLVGLLSGGAFAMHCAQYLGKQVTTMDLVSSRVPSLRKSERLPRLLASFNQRLSKYPWIRHALLNILRNRASHKLCQRLIMKVYGSLPEDADYLKCHPQIWNHMAASAMQSMTNSIPGNEINCFVNEVEKLSTFDCQITVWHGAKDLIADYQLLRDELLDQINTTHLYSHKGALLNYQIWPHILQKMAQSSTRMLELEDTD